MGEEEAAEIQAKGEQKIVRNGGISK